MGGAGGAGRAGAARDLARLPPGTPLIFFNKGTLGYTQNKLKLASLWMAALPSCKRLLAVSTAPHAACWPCLALPAARQGLDTPAACCWTSYRDAVLLPWRGRALDEKQRACLLRRMAVTRHPCSITYQADREAL